MARVSVIVPVYNEERYLEECLDSICRQTLKDMEIICVDDGSTDQSGVIMDRYMAMDSRIKVIHKKNTGYGNSMNVGLKSATGEYIGIVESDDWIQPEMMQTLYEAAQLYRADFVKTDFYRFVRQTDGTIRRIYNRLAWDTRYYNRVIAPSDEIETFQFVMNIWCGIYQRKFIERNKISFHETPGASFQDNGFWFQTFALAKRAVFLDRPFYMNRRDNPLSSVNRRDKVYAACTEYDHIRQWVKGLTENRKCYEYLCSEGRLRNYFFTIDRIEDKYKEEFYLRFQKDYLELTEAGEIAETLLPERWRQRIGAIVEDPIKACRTEMEDRKRFFDIIGPFKDIVIYGAGAWGRKAWSVLSGIGARNRIAYFAVTDKKGNPPEPCDIPIVELSALSKEFRREALVLVAAKGEARKQMVRNIKAEGYEHYTDSMIFFE